MIFMRAAYGQRKRHQNLSMSAPAMVIIAKMMIEAKPILLIQPIATIGQKPIKIRDKPIKERIMVAKKTMYFNEPKTISFL